MTLFTGLARGVMDTGGMMMTEAAQVHAAVKAFYLALPGKTEEGWQAVAQDPRLFNRVWRRMLGQAAGTTPPEVG